MGAVTTKRAASLLGISRQHVTKLIRAGRLDAYNIGSCTVPNYRVLTESIEQLRVRGTPGAHGILCARCGDEIPEPGEQEGDRGREESVAEPAEPEERLSPGLEQL